MKSVRQERVYATNSIKFIVMASGVDTKSIVTDMVASYKLKVDAAKGKQYSWNGKRTPIRK